MAKWVESPGARFGRNISLVNDGFLLLDSSSTFDFGSEKLHLPLLHLLAVQDGRPLEVISTNDHINLRPYNDNRLFGQYSKDQGVWRQMTLMARPSVVGVSLSGWRNLETFEEGYLASVGERTSLGLDMVDTESHGELWSPSGISLARQVPSPLVPLAIGKWLRSGRAYEVKRRGLGVEHVLHGVVDPRPEDMQKIYNLGKAVEKATGTRVLTGN